MSRSHVSPFFTGLFAVWNLERLEIVPHDADTGKIINEADATPPVVERQERFGLFFLAGDLPAVGPEKTQAPLALPERPMIGHALEFDRGRAEGRIGVEDGDRKGGAAEAAAIQGSGGPKRDRPGHILGPAILAEGVPFGRLDAGARENIVKIVENMELPGFAELRFGEVAAGEPRGSGRDGLGLDEAPEIHDRPPLEAGERGVTPGEASLEVAVEDGGFGRGGLHRFVEPVRRAVDDPDPRFAGDEGVDRPKVAPRRPAAVIAQAPKDGHVTAELQGELDAVMKALFDIVMFGMVEPDGDAIGRDLRAVDAAPSIKIGGKRELVGLGPHVDVHLVASKPQDLGQAAAVAERIEVVGDAGRGPELLPEIAPAFGDRPDERLGPGQVDVGLDEPAAGDRPAAGPDVAADGLEERRVQPLDRLVEDGLVVAEDEVRMFVEDVGGVPKGRQRFRRPLIPPPLPNGIEVRVTYEVYRQIRGHNTRFRIISLHPGKAP